MIPSTDRDDEELTQEDWERELDRREEEVLRTRRIREGKIED